MLKISKAELRNKIFEARAELKPEQMKEWDERLMERLLSVPAIARLFGADKDKEAHVVYCYISVRNEAGTEKMLRYFLDRGVRVAVPRVKKKVMDFFYIKGVEDLEPGGFGIPEPVASCQRAEEKNAPVIVPGVAFSRLFERTGYGAGYYDKFFASEPEHEKIAVCYELQLFDSIQSDEYDVPMDYIVTQNQTLCRREKGDA